MKNLLLTIILFNLSIFADYSTHKDSRGVIDELVRKHGFEAVSYTHLTLPTKA